MMKNDTAAAMRSSSGAIPAKVGVSRVPLARLGAVAVAAACVAAGCLIDRLLRPRKDAGALLACRVRRAFERLGPTFVKAGQLMSSSSGSLPGAWAEELSHCCDDVPSLPWPVISRFLDSELGERRRVLVSVDPAPLAAGSMAQVHAGTLADGSRVVVKIQRPGLQKILADDVRLLRLAARVVERLSPLCAAANVRALVEDFAEGLGEQLSFRREADNAEQMRAVLDLLAPRVRVPRVHRELSTDRVLVMERLLGVDTGELSSMRRAADGGSSVVPTIIASLVVPALAAGVFHGDMHPGNMLVLADDEVGLVDFGVVNHLAPDVRAAASDLLDALADRRFADVVLAMLRLVDPGTIDVAALVPEVQVLVGSQLDKPLAGIDVKDAVTGVLQLASRNGLALPESLLSFFKQVVYISGMCQSLDPEFDLLAGLVPVLRLARQAAAA